MGDENYVTTSTLSLLRNMRDRVLKTLYYTTLTVMNRFPTTFQMSKGLDENNAKEVFHQNYTISSLNKDITVNFTGLNDSSIYNIFISLVNDYPVPQMMNDYYVGQLNTKTLLKREKLIVQSIHFSAILKILMIFVVLILVQVLL